MTDQRGGDKHLPLAKRTLFCLYEGMKNRWEVSSNIVTLTVLLYTRKMISTYHLCVIIFCYFWYNLICAVKKFTAALLCQLWFKGRIDLGWASLFIRVPLASDLTSQTLLELAAEQKWECPDCSDSTSWDQSITET